MRGFSEPRPLGEVGGEMTEEPERFHAASDLKSGDAAIDQNRNSESVHRAGHRARLTTYRNMQMIVHHREATDGHRKTVSELLQPALNPFLAVVFFIAYTISSTHTASHAVILARQRWINQVSASDRHRRRLLSNMFV
jgi:hypothetical protein